MSVSTSVAKVGKISNRGSRPGERRGGRQKGTRNKRTDETVKAAAASGLMPLDYMLQAMRDPTVEPTRRDDMAKAVAPYLHPRLAAIEHSGGLELGIRNRSDAELEEDIQRAAAEAQIAIGIARESSETEA